MVTEGPILRYRFTVGAPFLHHGSRYGHVGAFPCKGCGAKVNLLGDCDPPVRYFAAATGRAAQETLRYEELYRINAPDSRWAERWTGLNLLSSDGDKALGPENIVARLAEVRRRALPAWSASYTLAFATWVPESLREWLDLRAAPKGSPQDQPPGPDGTGRTAAAITR
ncbi:hypothetical protein SAMN00790413_02819 [Deinococcus hopiensis KR-140]|uniref:Uncharacterized protein n=2 Tax=Deinococcus TaxID=1298 RepID=A0A1W1VPV0_9DEIO|nr:hypothetical protein SAMN00790413_02819 [Deinococcus hopiensis KR-140]